MFRRLPFSAALLAMTVMLASCGDGGSLASAPAPLAASPLTVVSRTTEIGAELPPTPATTAGTYDTIGVRYQTDAAGNQITAARLDPGQLKLTVEPASKTYTIEFDPNLFPGISAPGNTLSYTIDDSGYNHVVTQTTKMSDGRTNVSTEPRLSGQASRQITINGADKPSDFFAVTATEKRYVALGAWRWWSPGKPEYEYVDFAFGDRTPAADIPTSGTATYVTDAYDIISSRLGYNLDSANIKLTADFASRSMAADMSLSFLNFDKSYAQPRLSGTGPIASSGSFAIPLTGVMDFMAVKSDPVSGSISGALFGPDASQIGATFVLSPDGQPEITGAFVGVRQ
jgi:hypothetical protein